MEDGTIAGQEVFLSTLSLRRATVSMVLGRTVYGFLSTLSLRRATEGPAKLPKQIRISIHALLAESDVSPKT